MKIIEVCVVLLLITACGSGERNVQLAESLENNISSIDEVTIDPCDVVLAPLDTTDQIASIAGYQQAVLRNNQSLPNLEKLGWALISKARASSDTGYYKLAEQAAQCIEQRQNNSLAALLLKGHVLHNLHNFKAAEVLARQLIEQRGLWFEYGLLGDVLLEQGSLTGAAEAYQVMMDQRPGPQAYSRAAHLRWLKGDLSGAIEMMAMSVRAIGVHASEASAWTDVRLGLYLLQAGEFEKAQRVISRALMLHKDYAPALLAQGRLYLAQNKPNEAAQILTRAVRIAPLPEYQWLLIEALYANQKPGQAKKIEAQLKQTGAIEDRRTYALYLASTKQHTGEAVRLAKQDIETRQDVFSHDALAWSLYAANRIPEALQHIKHAVSEGTQDARLFFHAALITQAAGEAKQALYWRQKAKAIEHMLQPSERTLLNNKFAAFKVATTHPGTQ